MIQTDLNTSEYWDVCNWWLLEPRSIWRPTLDCFCSLYNIYFLTLTDVLNNVAHAFDFTTQCGWLKKWNVNWVKIINHPLCFHLQETYDLIILRLNVQIFQTYHFVQFHFVSPLFNTTLSLSLFHLKHCHWQHYDLRVACVSGPFMVSDSCVVLPLPSFFSHSARLCRTMS